MQTKRSKNCGKQIQSNPVNAGHVLKDFRYCVPYSPMWICIALFSAGSQLYKSYKLQYICNFASVSLSAITNLTLYWYSCLNYYNLDYILIIA